MEVRSEQTPARYLTIGERTYWRHDGKWYVDIDSMDQEALAAVLATRSLLQASRVDRAKMISAQGQLPASVGRQRIADDIRLLVWTRDGGACQACGSRTEMQYDHIIPVAHGGGSTEANVQILCGPCNRRKGASVTGPSGMTSPATPATPVAQALPPAGWYEDPSGAGGLRFWDGAEWTDHTRA